MSNDSIEVLGQMDNSDGTFESANRVYGSNGIAPTIPTSCGGGHTPKVMKIKSVLTDSKEKLQCLEQSRAEQSRAEQSSLVYVRQATKKGYVPCEIGGVADLNYPDSNTRRGRVIEKGQVSPTLTTENTPSVLEKFTWIIDNIKYLIRIRKLTPRECWRLMDFTDEDFDKAEKVNSNTQLYKQAGNSIVKNVLVAIIGQMIEGKENVYREVTNENNKCR